jgi:hypothetical protein
MATMKPTNLQPVCRVEGCKNGAQMYSILGNTASWMKTCQYHNYLDLPEEKEKLETFWPPESNK